MLNSNRIYRCWKNMRRRCNNPNTLDYKYYGGRGIKVCKRWESFILFEKDMSPSYNDNLTLDRIDSNKNYSPTNCKWSTHLEQMRNTSRNTKYKINGTKYIITELERIYKIDRHTILARFRRGIRGERLLIKNKKICKK